VVADGHEGALGDFLFDLGFAAEVVVVEEADEGEDALDEGLVAGVEVVGACLLPCLLEERGYGVAERLERGDGGDGDYGEHGGPCV
jgi:hypothetical protein